jgi:hypothetical protein
MALPERANLVGYYTVKYINIAGVFCCFENACSWLPIAGVSFPSKDIAQETSHYMMLLMSLDQQKKKNVRLSKCELGRNRK